MPYVKIIGNQFHRSQNPQKVLLMQSYGRTDDGTAVGVRGICTPTTTQGGSKPDARPPVVGTPISFKRGKGGSFCRWRLLFPGLEPGSYNVTVEAFDANSKPLGGDRETVNAPGPIKDRLQINDPANGDDITGMKDDFVAQGDTTTTVTSAVMTPPSGPANDMQAIDIFCDPTGFQYWSAEFDTLTQIGEYTLTVSDGNITQFARRLRCSDGHERVEPGVVTGKQSDRGGLGTLIRTRLAGHGAYRMPGRRGVL